MAYIVFFLSSVIGGSTYCCHSRHIPRKFFGLLDDFEFSVILKFPKYFRLFDAKDTRNKYIEVVERDPRLTVFISQVFSHFHMFLIFFPCIGYWKGSRSNTKWVTFACPYTWSWWKIFCWWTSSSCTCKSNILQLHSLYIFVGGKLCKSFYFFS